MQNPSRYDYLHDKYFVIRTTKSGTRYERLAAFVFKVLEESGIVIHDLKLTGETGVKHQIDVKIELDGKQKRILIECKDFDVSGDKVGLDIVRNFWGVVDDIKPDEALIITCNGFTKDAQMYAKGKGIKLAVIRDFREEDWEGRIKTIAFTMHIYAITEPNVEIVIDKQEYIEKLNEDMKNAGIQGRGIWKGQPVYLNTPEARYQINEFIEIKQNEYPRDNLGPVELKIPLDGSTLEVLDLGGVPIKGIIIRFEVVHAEEYFEITANKVAELIIKGVGEKDYIVFDQDLKRCYIDENTGEILFKDN